MSRTAPKLVASRAGLATVGSDPALEAIPGPDRRRLMVLTDRINRTRDHLTELTEERNGILGALLEIDGVKKKDLARLIGVTPTAINYAIGMYDRSKS